jgi:ABC-2 type transport system permease protein
MGKITVEKELVTVILEEKMRKLLYYELRARRWAMVGWGLGLAIFAGYIIILFEDFAEQLSGFNIEDIAIYEMLGDFGDFSTFSGFVSAEVFTFLPVLLAVYAIVNGTGTLAGEEDSGRLEPIIALPIPRWKLVITKFLALAIAILVILAIVALSTVIAFYALPDSVDTGSVEAADLAVATLAAWPLIMLFGALGLFLGAFFPTRRAATVTATIVLVVGYFGNNLAGLINFLGDVNFLFPFKYYSGRDTLLNGINIEDTLIMLGASAILLTLAVLAFQRRNVTVGDWPWQRARVPVSDEGSAEIATSAAAD